MDTKTLYFTNKDFHEYVDKYSQHYQSGKKISVSEALEHEIVKEVAKQYNGTNA